MITKTYRNMNIRPCFVQLQSIDVDLLSRGVYGRNYGSHVPILSHKCPKCDRKFYFESDFKKHLNKHTSNYKRPSEDTTLSEKLFRCKVCDKTFNHSGSLSVHKRIHENDRRFCCNLCPGKFQQRGTLQTHMRLHTGIYIKR